MKLKLPSQNLSSLKLKALLWANAQSEVLCYLDSNTYPDDQYSQYECLLAVGVETELKMETVGNAFDALKAFSKKHQKWLFGHLNYDLKNEVEALESTHPDGLAFPELYFIF